ncbi:hypothetical protein ACHAXM_003953 [Skeletonema potamos]
MCLRHHQQQSNSKSINSTNEECSEILNVAWMKLLQKLFVKVNKSLSARDLQSLKEQGPFLYYSIPGVREATIRLENVDMHQIAQNGLGRGCQSCRPASIQTDASTSEPIMKVKRYT